MGSVRNLFGLKALTVALVLWALILHGCFLVSAGALWRDEATSVNQAEVGSWKALWGSLRYDSFPALYPAFLHVLLPRIPSVSERAFRILGVVTGLALLASIGQAARLLGSRFPVAALALIAIDPVLISEGDSIRPYGIGLLCLVWSFCAHGRLLLNSSPLWLAIASAASILAVQANYTGAVFVGVLSLSAGSVVLARRSPRMFWKVLLPGFLAGLSLIPYLPVLRQAGGWASLLRYQVDWLDYFRSYIRQHSIAPAIGWLMLPLLGACSLRRLLASGGNRFGPHRSLTAYCVLAAAMGFAAQVLLVEFIGIAPFPRYFLPALMLAALALELLVQELKPQIRFAAAVFVLLITIVPSWSWMRLGHSNVDIVAKILSDNAGRFDLVVLSPWFLHPSFQRYYTGPAPWVTVPDLRHEPMTRYDLFKEAMADPQREIGLYEKMQRTLARGGAIWFVSQIQPDRPAESVPPDPPSASAPPLGADYARFRAYWERAIMIRLYSCCEPFLWPMPPGNRVWEEERLVLTLWRPVAGGMRRNN